MSQAKQIVRARGVDAVTDPEVAAVLQLTADQKQRMREVRQKNAVIMKQCVVRERQQRTGSRGIHELLRDIQRKSHEQILAILSAEQRLVFDRMKSSSAINLNVDPQPPSPMACS